MVNKNAIDILARKVATLTRSQHGSVQVQRQRTTVDGEVWGHGKPMAICMENIYAMSRLYSGYWNPATSQPMVFRDATFVKYTLRNGLDEDHSATIPDAYNFLAGAQDECPPLAYPLHLLIS